MPFFDGTVSTSGQLDLPPLQVGQNVTLRDGVGRHERMLRDGEFDAAEVSLSSYVMAKARGMAFTAIPVFPRRLFSRSQMFVNADSEITSPHDLAGRRVGLQSFQTTLAVRAKGDVAHECGTSLKDITWCMKDAETVSFEPGTEFAVERLPADADMGRLLAAGEIDALFFSRMPKSPPGRLRRLFPDPIAEEARYFGKFGFWPIMHVIALRDDVVARAPDAPQLLVNAFAEAKRIWAEYTEDPNWSNIAWARQAVERQRELLTDDPWPIGLGANLDDLRQFVTYSRDQGLIDAEVPVESLFHESVLEI